MSLCTTYNMYMHNTNYEWVTSSRNRNSLWLNGMLEAAYVLHMGCSCLWNEKESQN